MKSRPKILVCDPVELKGCRNSDKPASKLTSSPERLKELEAEFVNLPELLTRSDVVTIHVPYTSETHHMISRRELELMKKDRLHN